jgi:hypothetical protein
MHAATAPENLDVEEPMFLNVGFSGVPAGDINPQEMLFDGGSSHHLTGDKSVLFNFTALNVPIALKVATDGNTQFVTARGALCFIGPHGTPVEITDVLYCVCANVTIISPAALCLQGIPFSYDPSNSSFMLYSHFLPWLRVPFNQHGRKWSLPQPLQATSVSSLNANVGSCPSFFNSSTTPIDINELFPVAVPEPRPVEWSAAHLNKAEKLLLFYHKRFGHVSLCTLRRMIALKVGKGLPASLPPGKIHCALYWIAKSKAVPTLGSEKPKLERLEVLNVDLIGPFETKCFNGGKYLFTF